MCQIELLNSPISSELIQYYGVETADKGIELYSVSDCVTFSISVPHMFILCCDWLRQGHMANNRKC